MEPDGRPTLPLDAALDTIAVLVTTRDHALDAIVDLILDCPELRDGVEKVAQKLAQ